MPDVEPATAAPPAGSRIAFERLRERTDELELIISGLVAFALLTVPGRVFETWAGSAVHLDGLLWHALWMGFLVCVGLSYALAGAFIVHLATRGYWVALIGLKSTFPGGIGWDALPLMGPVTRAYHRRQLGDLGDAIDRIDRLASTLFALAILVGFVMAWMGMAYVLVILAAHAAGLLFTASERAASMLLLAVAVTYLVLGLAPLLLERLVARRRAGGREASHLVRAAHRALHVYGRLFPQRLVLPIQLTVQSNLPSRRFVLVYYALIVASMVFGGLHVIGSERFSLLDRYDVITDAAVAGGMRSAHYETQRSDHDLMQLVPMIASDRVTESYLRVFIPHRPMRDNPLARAQCAGLDDGRNTAGRDAAAAIARDCLAQLWTVTLDEAPVALDDFVPTERRDLGMRGLTGYLPLAGLAPGRHDLHMVWNPSGPDTGQDRMRVFTIPFWFMPTQAAAPAP